MTSLRHALALGCLSVALGCSAGPPDAAPAPPSVATPEPQAPSAPEVVRRAIDLNARIEEFIQDRPDATDGEFYVYRSPEATVHMHIIGVGQMCPLHIHRTTREATIIIAGEPEVMHVHGQDGALTRATRTVPPGHLVYSPPLCGHRWTNVEPRPQANLVIASPKFDGNLYLHPDDPRMLPGPAPTIVDPFALLATHTTDTTVPLDLGPGSMAPASLALHLVYDTLTVHDDPARDTILYVAAGTGAIQGQPLRTGTALVLQGGEPETITATEPMVLWAFTPERPTTHP